VLRGTPSSISPTDAWAVGYYGKWRHYPLIEHWDGVNWAVVDAPPLSGPDNPLYGVAAVSSSDVWAVGEHDLDSGAYLALSMHWDGAAWTVIPPRSPGVDSTLLDVSALSQPDIWAAGAMVPESGNRFLIEHSQGCEHP